MQSGRKSYCSDQCRPKCTVAGCTSDVTSPASRLCALHDSRRREGAPLVRKCETCGVEIESQPKKTRRCGAHNYCDVPQCENQPATKGLCRKHYRHKMEYGATHTPCRTCGNPINLGPGRHIYCSKECRPVCVHPTCDKPTRGADNVCSSHRKMRSTHGELRPDTWAKAWICVVCGSDVAKGSGRRKHCSSACQALDSAHRGLRPKSATCALCGEKFSLVGKSGSRIQRTDTKWCPSCGRESSEVLRFKNYGVTPEMYDQAIRNGCEICGVIVDTLHVDHDHKCCPSKSNGKTRTCGKCVRGFLCGPCNRGIGMMQDDADRLLAAARYLTKTR